MTDAARNAMEAAERLRRTALEAAALSPLALATGALGAAGHHRPTIEEDWDVVVIGSGAAGLAAAIEAREAGARVLLIEKMGSIGGNSALADGLVSVPNSPAQRALGITDSPEAFARDLLAQGRINHPAKVRSLAQGALDAFLWTQKEIGVRWFEDRVEYDEFGVRRAALVRSRNGMGLVYPLAERALALGVAVRLGWRAGRFILRENAGGGMRAAGVEAASLRTGEVRALLARRGVVIAAGGFAADVALRTMQAWRLSARAGTTSQPGSTGEMLRAASRIGAWLIHLEYIQCIPDAHPEEKGWGAAWRFSRFCAASQGVWVARQTGRRYVNELGETDAKTTAVFDLLGFGQDPVAVADARAVRHPHSAIFSEADVEDLVARGYVSRYPTLESLAREEGIPLAPLKAEIKAWNDAVRSGANFDRLGRPIGPLAEPMSEAPWYAAPMLAKVIMTNGGIATDARARVLSVADDQPIPGLYAAGEVTGGVLGVAYAASCGLIDALVNGRIAGREAARGA